MANALQQPEAGLDNAFQTEDARRAADVIRADRERQIQSLNMQRLNILSQKTSNPSRRAALETALQQIEAEIKAFG